MRVINESLTCNYLTSPLAVETECPLFSFKCQLEKNGDTMSAYRIMVSTNKDVDGDMWDSGKVQSDSTIHIKYSGKKLEAGCEYYWKAMVWDGDDNASDWSGSALFRMGIDEDDWQGKWISIADIPVMMGGGQGDGLPAPMLRKSFKIDKPVKSAYIQICGLGYYDLWLNGEKVGDLVLDPAPTKFDETALYQTYDVTDSLNNGENAVGVILGDGWYNCFTEEVWCFDKASWRGYPRLLLQLDVELVSGEKITVASDNTWKAATGAITFNGLRNGENYDARLEHDGWSEPSFDDEEWKDVTVVRSPGGFIRSQQMTPIRKIMEIKPISVTQVMNNVWVFDVGQNMSGWARIKMAGRSGQTLTIRYSEKIHENSELDRGNIDCFIKTFDFQTDRYTFKGDGIEEWEPRFTYHGFRYIEVSGVEHEFTCDDLTAIVVHTDFERRGEFSCSNELLNSIQKCAHWATVSNYHGIPTDCPHREKNGWTGDASLSCEQVLYNYNATTAYRKWLYDFKDVQRNNGELPGIIPTSAWGYNWGNGPAWDSALILIPWYMYLYRGDKQILCDMYENMKRYIKFIKSMAIDNIVDFGLGDWCPPEGNENLKTPSVMTDTGYYHIDCEVMSKVAKVLGKEKDSRYFSDLASDIKKAYNERFVDVVKDKVGTNSQTSFATTLYQELAEDNDKEKILEMLVDEVENCDDHIDCGILGTKYVMHTLADMDRCDVAYKIASQDTYPSWGNWIRRGATTLWEDWDGRSSQNHHMYSDISAWFYKGLAGINPDENAPGFKHFYIKPNPVGDLTWVDAWHDSLYGRIEVNWKLDEMFHLDVTIPANTTATIALPKEYSRDIKVDGVALESHQLATILGVKNSRYEFILPAGRYNITSK